MQNEAEEVIALQDAMQDHALIALLYAAVLGYEAEFAAERAQFFGAAYRGRPEVRSEIGHRIILRFHGQAYELEVFRLDREEYRIAVDGTAIGLRVQREDATCVALSIADKRYRLASVIEDAAYRITVDGVQHTVHSDAGVMVRAASPAVVVSVAVSPSDFVTEGDRLAVLEAMKMEMEIASPVTGQVREVLTMANAQVGPGTLLFRIDKDGAATRPSNGSERLQFSSLAAKPTAGLFLQRLRQLMLGFDVKPEHTISPKGAPSVEDQLRLEDEVLAIFLDICDLFRHKPRARQGIVAESPSAEACLFAYLHMPDMTAETLPPTFGGALLKALSHYGLNSLDPCPEREEALLWIYKSHQRTEPQIAALLRILKGRLALAERAPKGACHEFKALLDRIISVGRSISPALTDIAHELRFRCFDEPFYEEIRRKTDAEIEDHLDTLGTRPDTSDRAERVQWLVDCPRQLARLFSKRFENAPRALQQTMLEVMTSRYYCMRQLSTFRALALDGMRCVTTSYEEGDVRTRILTVQSDMQAVSETLTKLSPELAKLPQHEKVVLDLMCWSHAANPSAAEAHDKFHAILQNIVFPRSIERIVFALSAFDQNPGQPEMLYFTFEPTATGFEEVQLFRGVHPATADRLTLWRLSNFNFKRLPSPGDIYLLHATAKTNPKDERLFAVAEVRDMTPIRDAEGKLVRLPHLERMFAETVAAIRGVQTQRALRERLYWNRIFLYIYPTVLLTAEEIDGIIHRLAPSTDGLGLEQVVVRARFRERHGEVRDSIVRLSSPGDGGLLMTFRPAAKQLPIKPLSAYDQKVVKMRQRGLTYPYEIIKLLTPAAHEDHADCPPGQFVEHDLDATSHLVPVDRPYGENTANIVAGVITNFTPRYPEGMKRVILLGDPIKDMGAIAEPECRRIIAGLDLAEQMRVPLEWFALSAGAKISMSSGVENMDWVARVLRRLIEFTQAGNEVNIIVNGINVGAQPYWNAEATMLMHTRGILIMTPKGAMVLTGKRALDYSGSVSADDNFGIGGYDRIMGVNGQAQYFARNIDDACQILMRHYEHTYVEPGERFPRRAASTDPITRDVREYSLGDTAQNGFTKVGDIFSDEKNPGRKHAFDIRRVMLAVSDQDHVPLERFAGMRAAESTVVWDSHLGGYPVCLIGIESKPLPRFGFVPADGPEHWTSGTLFPLSSKKVARAINAASGNRPVVVLANLSGFDGSPESMRRLQLEYGAEIGRAVTNFKGPFIFCVISRYHGGAYVVFSKALNPDVEVVALEGTFASVIGGAPAAAVVFAGEVEKRTRAVPKLRALADEIAQAELAAKAKLQAKWNELFPAMHSEKLGEVAAEFDHIHSVHRALEVGALDKILPARDLRPYLIESVERGMRKHQAAFTKEPHAIHDPLLAGV